MELAAIMLVGTIGLIAAPLYCLTVARFIRPIRPLANVGYWVSIVLLSLLLIEIVLAVSRGVIGSRELIGPAFIFVHLVLGFSAAPALCCVLLLGRKAIAWPIAAVLGWFAGMAALLYQFHVSETLYGIEGIGGPYVFPI